MKDETRFRVGFILLMVSGLVLLYSNMDVIGTILAMPLTISANPPTELLPNYITIPMLIPFIIGFCFFFRTDEPAIETKESMTKC